MPHNEIPISPEATQAYTFVQRVLSQLVELGERLVYELAGRQAESHIPDYASRLFIKQLLHARAVLKVAPDFETSPTEKLRRLDPSSIAVLGRAVLETYLSMYYLCAEEVDEEERSLRFLLWEYHDLKSRLKGRRNANPKDKDINTFERLLEEKWESISLNEKFQHLSEGERREFRKGRKPMLITNEEIAERAGIHPTRYRNDYIHLSSFAHAGPLAMARMRDYYTEADAILHVMGGDLKTVITYLFKAYLDVEKIAEPVPDLVPKEIRDTMMKWNGQLSSSLHPE